METGEVRVGEVIDGLKFATNLALKANGEENGATPDVMETDMTCNNHKSIFEDCFDSTLNHTSPTFSPKPSPKPSPEHTSSPVQQSKPVVESLNPKLVIHVLENAINLVKSEHPAGELTDDQKHLTYFYDSEQPPPFNTMYVPPITVSSGKASFGSKSETEKLILLRL